MNPRSSLLIVTAVASLLVATSAFGYRVFLDYDTDGDLTTFVNEVVGPVSAPITLVVVFGPEDVGVSSILFHIEWDCEEGGFCAVRHGLIEVGGINIPPIYPFSNGQVLLCLTTTCACSANYGYQADVASPPPVGNWELVEQEFTRVGLNPGCGDMTYSEVEFRVVCPDCDYEAGDDARARMVLRESPLPAAHSTWGQIKALFGE